MPRRNRGASPCDTRASRADRTARVTFGRLARGAFVAVALAAVGARPAAAQEGEWRGRVIDAATGRPVADAEVLIAGDSTFVTRSDPAGIWRLRGAAVSAATIRVRRTGYRFRTLVAAAGADVVVALAPLPIALDQIVVTAARREQRLGDAVIATEVVSRADIDRTGASDVGAALTQQTGVQLEAGVPSGAGVQLQGFGAQRVLILVDGQPFTGRVNGTLDLSRVPTAMVDRIEIVKGPQSTLYGSDALGGVINIVTRRPDRSEVDGTISVTAGTQERREVAASIGAGAGRFAALLDGGYRHSALAPGVSGTNATYADRWDAAPRIRFVRDSSLAVDVSLFAIGERQRYRVGQLYQFADNRQLTARLGLTRRSGAHQFMPVLSYSQFDHLSRASTEPQPVGTAGDRDHQGLAQLQLGYAGPLLGAMVDAGIDARREDITADRVLGRTRIVSAVEPFAQATITVGALSIVPGARYTWSDRWGTNLAPRLAALWRPTDALTIRGAIGGGFRAPDFKELYLTFVNAAVGYAVAGNPTLRPERSENASVSVQWTPASGFARIGAFHNRYHDFIEFVGPDGTGTYTYGNVAEGTTSGIESDGALVLGAARLDAGYAWLRTRDTRTDQPLLGRPEHSARVGVSAPLAGSLRASLTALYTGETPSARAANGTVTSTQPAFTRVNVRFVTRLPMSVEFTVAADNVLDQQLGPAWPAFTGRSVYVALSWRPDRGRLRQ